MGKKNKKRSNNKKGGGGSKPPRANPKSADDAGVLAAAAAAANASVDDNSNPPITPPSSPEKTAVAAAELPAPTVTTAASESNDDDVPLEEEATTLGTTPQVVVDEKIANVDVDGDADEKDVLQQSSAAVKDNDDTAKACLIVEEVVVKAKDSSSFAASKDSSSDESPAPVALPPDSKSNDQWEEDAKSAVAAVAPKEETEANLEAETTTTMIYDALNFPDDLVPDDAAAASVLPAMKQAVAKEETVPAEEAVIEAASSLIESVQAEIAETAQKAEPVEPKEESVPAAKLLAAKDAMSSAKENVMDTGPVAQVEEQSVTTNSASSSGVVSNPTPTPIKTNNTTNFESRIETPSPSKVADLKSKLWDSKGLQVRIRPSLTAADLQRKHSSPLAPVPSPYKPTAAPPSSGVVSNDADVARATRGAIASVTGAATSATDVEPVPKNAASTPLHPSSSNVASPATSTAATGLSANNNGRRLARRKGPTAPKSILDEKALLAALQERGVAMKDMHISAFYQALHRQQYPDLATFVENFYKHENNKQQQVELLPALTGPSAQTAVSQYTNKNRNKMQLPKAFLEFLSDPRNGFATMTSKIVEAQTSLDKSTTKLAIELHDGKMIESVLMRYNKNSQENHRASLCISSQCGCAMGCTFCATGMMGLSGNLTTAEILEQIIHADGILAREWAEQQQEQNKQQQHVQDQQQASNLRTKKQRQKKPALDAVRNVVFMGMGEPLDNYTNVVEACRALMDRKRWNLAHGRVTVSTVGLVSQMRKISQDLPHVNLALSLHAPTQEMRIKIVPSAKRYPIEELVDALDGHMTAYLNSPERRLHVNRQQHGVKEKAVDDNGGGHDDDDMSRDDDAPDNTNVDSNSKEICNTRRRAMIEYIMLVGETSTETSAHELGKLCQDKSFVVNLIPYNATNVKDPLKCPTYDEMQKFRGIVASYGVFCTVRRTMGSDIDSACGQLITLQQQQQQQKQQQHDQGAASATGRVRDIEDASRTCQPRSNAGNDAPTSISQKSTTTTTATTAKANANKKDDGNNDKDDFDKYIGPLAIATVVVATCFLASIFFRRRT